MSFFIPRRRAVLLLLMIVAEVTSKSDSNYYPSDLGMSDPNLVHKMYWAEAIDLLHDLSAFDALYVTHHNCVWSSYDEGCGAQPEDDELWYMGLAPCFRANAAFSLYGILKGERDRGCNRKTFINSFMTSNGVESFTTAMKAAGVNFTSSYNNNNGYPGGVTSECSVISEGQNDDGGAMLNDYYNSYGVACSSSGEYVSSFFKGAFCRNDDVIGTKDLMDTFNKDISQSNCIAIYRASNRYNYNYGQRSPLSILGYSHTCSVGEYPKSCPDPFGKIKIYERALALSTGQKHNPRDERIRMAISRFLLLIGVIALAVPVVLARRRKFKTKQEHDSEDDSSIKKRTLWQRFMQTVRKQTKPSNENNSSSDVSSTGAIQ